MRDLMGVVVWGKRRKYWQKLKVAPSRAGVEDTPGTWRTKWECWGDK